MELYDMKTSETQKSYVVGFSACWQVLRSSLVSLKEKLCKFLFHKDLTRISYSSRSGSWLHTYDF